MVLPVIGIITSVAITAVTDIFTDKIVNSVQNMTETDIEDENTAKIISLVLTFLAFISTVIFYIFLFSQKLFKTSKDGTPVMVSAKNSLISFLILQTFFFICSLDLIDTEFDFPIILFITLLWLDSLVFIICLCYFNTSRMAGISNARYYIAAFIMQFVFFIFYPTHPMIYFIFTVLAKLCMFLKIFLTILTITQCKSTKREREDSVDFILDN